MESPGTEHGLVSASIVRVGEHIYDWVGHRRYEESDVAYDGDYLEAVVEVVHVTLSGMLHRPKWEFFTLIAEVLRTCMDFLHSDEIEHRYHRADCHAPKYEGHHSCELFLDSNIQID